MRTWLILLGGLLLWTGHFFLLYGIGEFVGETAGPRILVILLTLAFLAAAGLLAARLWRTRPTEAHDRWRRAAGLGMLLLSAIAIVWQGFPALFVP